MCAVWSTDHQGIHRLLSSLQSKGLRVAEDLVSDPLRLGAAAGPTCCLSAWPCLALPCLAVVVVGGGD